MVKKALPPRAGQNSSRSEQVGELMNKVGADALGESETHLGDFIEGTPSGDLPHFLYTPSALRRRAKVDVKNGGASARNKDRS